jgi:hypothetical protein
MGGFQASFKDAPEPDHPDRLDSRGAGALDEESAGGRADVRDRRGPLGRRHGPDGACAAARRLVRQADREIPAKRFRGQDRQLHGRQGGHARRDGALIVLDMGGGYGGACYEILRENGFDVRPTRAPRRRRAARRTSNSASSTCAARRSGASARRSTPTSPAAPHRAARRSGARGRPHRAAARPVLHGHQGRVEGRHLRPPRALHQPGDAVMMAWFEGPKALHTMVAPEHGTAQRRAEGVMGRQHG